MEIKISLLLSLLLLLSKITSFCSGQFFMKTKTGQCKTQTADYCFHHANENVTTIVSLFSNRKNNSPQSVRSLHFTLPQNKNMI